MTFTVSVVPKTAAAARFGLGRIALFLGGPATSSSYFPERTNPCMNAFVHQSTHPSMRAKLLKTV